MEEEELCTDVLDELRRLAEERGLECRDCEMYIGDGVAAPTLVFRDENGSYHECWDAGFGMVNVVVAMTPEQAVAIDSVPTWTIR